MNVCMYECMRVHSLFLNAGVVFIWAFFCAVCLGEAGQKPETRSGWDLCGTEWSEKDV